MRLILLIAAIFLSGLKLQAQPVLLPLAPPVFVPLATSVCPKRTLPFFDDFASGLDTQWCANRGVWVNNTLAYRAPTIFVASFDGVNAAGMPYSFADPAKMGVADSLISPAFDLKNYHPGDSITLSFFYQSGGLGEAPNEQDSLVLIFKTRTGTWKKIWFALPDTTKDFRLARVVLRDSAWYHENFQFAFYNIARTSGPFDVWNLDYVYFFEPANDNPRTRFDIAVCSSFSPLLGKYRTMPFIQFKARNPTTDTAFVEVFNLSQELKLIAHPVTLRQYEEVDSVFFLLKEQRVTTFSQGIYQSDQSTNLIEAGERLNVAVPISTDWMRTANLDSCWLEAEIALNTQENAPIRTTLNDTLRYRIPLKNFYAYDDGTAEYGIGLRQRFAKLAVRFVLEREDFLTDVDIYMPRIGFDQQGQVYRLYIWKHIDKRDTRFDKALLIQARTVQYSNTLNRFIRLSLVPPKPRLEDLILVRDTFYIGIQQLSEQMTPLGFDLNSNSQTETFYNIGTKWEPSTEPGSIMIRPVFRDGLVQVGLNDEPGLSVCPIPNPAKGEFWLNHPQITLVELIDTQGRKVLSTRPDSEGKVAVDGVLPGLYLVKISDGKHITICRLLVQEQ